MAIGAHRTCIFGSPFSKDPFLPSSTVLQNMNYNFKSEVRIGALLKLAYTNFALLVFC